MSLKLFLLDIPNRYLWWLAVGFAVFAVTGCASAPSPSPTTHQVSAPMHPESQAASAAHEHPQLEQRLRSEVRQWRGTPHRMGGDSRRGIDCSGFVHRLYQDIFDRQIPRSTALLAQSGRSINKNQLRTGDLVFFKVPSKGRHVGIYLGRSEFAHASTSKGVIVSSLGDRFWRQSYWTARRYLNVP